MWHLQATLLLAEKEQVGKEISNCSMLRISVEWQYGYADC